MLGPGCEGSAATTAASTVSMALPLLVALIITAACTLTVFACSFILGNGTSHIVWLSVITVI